MKIMFFKRLFRRIKFLFKDMEDIYTWEYESCQNCGNAFRIAYILKNKIWMKIVENEDKILCLDCLLKLASKKNISLNKNDFIWLSLFQAEIDKVNDIIEDKGDKNT